MGTVVTAVDVVRGAPGGLDVSWECTGSGPFVVAAGPTPETVGTGHPATRVEGATRVSLRGLGPGRHYVRVAPAAGGPGVVAAERLLPLEGASNFRDLGGYPTRDGGRTRWGQVFRADAPDRLTPADLAVLRPLGLRVAYDLRAADERASAPSALPDTVRRELLDIGGDAARANPLGDLFRSGSLDALPDDLLHRIYLDMAGHDAAAFGRVLTALAADDGSPAVVHCTAGKDRTGLTSALLLAVLGVDDGTIVDDYALSRAYFNARRMAALLPRLARLGLDEARYHEVFGAPRHAMAATLTALRDLHGSLTGYLTGPCGVPPEALTALRARLVTPAGA